MPRLYPTERKIGSATASDLEEIYVQNGGYANGKNEPIWKKTLDIVTLFRYIPAQSENVIRAGAPAAAARFLLWSERCRKVG